MEASKESRIITKSTLALVTIKKQLKGEDPWQAAFVFEGGFRRNLCERFPTKPMWEDSDEPFERGDAEWVFHLHRAHHRKLLASNTASPKSSLLEAASRFCLFGR